MRSMFLQKANLIIFEYGNITYKYVASRMQEGVVEAKNTTGVRITDLERTVVDSIRDLKFKAG